MKNKEIQEKRMKEYFIRATKEILKSEGIKSISVRNISEQAGYSYTTLYNYFKDINDLIFYCVNDFNEECKLFVENQTKENLLGKEKFRAKIIAYINYFIEYPSIFELFYIERMGDFGNKQTTINIISNSLDDIYVEELNYCINQNLIRPEKVEIVKSQFKYVVSGLLLLYLNRMIPISYEEFQNQVNVHIDSLLEVLFN
ncbi:MAG: TetR/AcrR family transcriptional regulator [Deltaproteobacteria bacterium]